MVAANGPVGIVQVQQLQSPPAERRQACPVDGGRCFRKFGQVSGESYLPAQTTQAAFACPAEAARRRDIVERQVFVGQPATARPKTRTRWVQCGLQIMSAFDRMNGADIFHAHNVKNAGLLVFSFRLYQPHLARYTLSVNSVFLALNCEYL